MAIFLSEGEQVIRRYNCAKVDFKSSDSTLDAFGLGRRQATTDCTVTVTNKRVIYFAESETPSDRTQMPSMHSQEAFVDRIAAMEFIQAENRRHSTFPFAMAIIGLVVTIMALMAGKTVFLVPGIALLAMGIAIFIPSLLVVKPMMLMRVNTTASDGGIHVSGLSPREEDSLSFYMVPNPDFVRMSKEIGALVLDLQNRGDACISDWKDE